MKNLIKNYMKTYRLEKSKFVNDLNGEKSIETILDKWFYSNLIPESSKRKVWANITELKQYLIKRWELKETTKLNTFLTRLQAVQFATDIKSITITIEWTKSKMWGNNAQATANVQYKNGGYGVFESSRTSGCGYDKESTAVGECLTQINGLLKPMYIIKNRKSTLKNHEIFGYGSGYGLLPYFEGGVGLSCYPRIIEKLKGKMNRISSGNTFDVYKIEFK